MSPRLWKSSTATTDSVYDDDTGTVGVLESTTDPKRRHELFLTGLTSSTEYFYKLTATDIAGNDPTTNTGRLSFVTRGEADVEGPQVFGNPVAIGITNSSAIIRWGANERHSSEVILQEVAAAGAKLAVGDSIVVEDIELGKRKAVPVDNLDSGTTYSFRVATKDPFGNTSFSEHALMKFTTRPGDDEDEDAPVIVRGPFVRNVTSSSARVNWFLNELSDCRIAWATDADFAANGEFTNTIEEAASTVVCSATLTELLEDTGYHFAVGSSDNSGNVVKTDPGEGIIGLSFDHGFRTRPDVAAVAPSIIEGPIIDATDNFVIIRYRTDQDATSRGEVGVLPASKLALQGGEPVFGEVSQIVVENTDELTTDHIVEVTGLTPGVQYVFQVTSTNADGLEITSTDPLTKLQVPGGFGSFTTNTDPDTQFPVITAAPKVVASTSSSLTVEWGSDEVSNSQLSAGASEDDFDISEISSDNVTTHRVVLTKLAAGTTYAYQAGSTDASGNGVTLSKVAFGSTPSDIDISAPVISVDASVVYKNDRQATIGWETSEAADAEVAFGTTEESLDQIRNDPDFNTAHTITLTNLDADQLYYYRVSSKDQSNNGPVSSDILSFQTDADPDVTSPVISNVVGSHNVFSGTSPTGPGNVDDSKTVELSIPLARGTYHWGVRSVDGGFSTSAESQEELFLVEDLVSSLQSIRPLQNSAIAWGDYDNDGDPDLVISGRDIDGIARALLYRNDAGRLVENSLVGLQGVQDGDLAWGDFDKDGDLDLALRGADASGNRNTHLYRNRLEMNDFALTAASRSDLPQLASSSVAWGDLDNDGDLDLTLMGTGNNVRVAVTYTNDDGDFVEAQTIQPVDNGDLAWGDVDNDEDLDLVTIGQIDNQGGANLVLYRNDSQGALTADTQSSLLGLLASSLALGDYDNDGDLDLAVCGFNFIEGFKTTLYRNDGTGQFSDSGLQFTGVAAGNLAWGDFDNDGDLDLVVVGVDAQSTERALVYRNEGTEFDEISIDILAGIAFATVAWGDLDLDGDLDLASSGRTSLDPSTVIPISRINDNLESRFNPNRSPSAPTGLTASPQGSGVTLSWSGGSDLGFDVTPDEALTYILRVGTEAGGNETASGAAPAGIGRILDPVTNLENLESGRYFWAVRSVDNGFARSEWSGEESFIIDTVSPVVDSVRIRPRVIRAGRRATVVISFTDEPAGMDNAVSPAVSLTISGGERPLPVNQVSFNGDLWLGEVEIVTPTAGGSVVVNVRGAQDLNGNQMAPVEELIAARFAPGAGGIVESQDGLVSLTVSPSVLPETLTESPDVKILPQAVDTPPSGRSAVGQAYEMIADPQFEFRKAATLAIGYAGQSVDENRLAIYQLVGSSWERIGGTVQQELDQVRVPVEQFGTYALFEETGTTGGSASITNVEFSNRAFTPLGGLRALRPGSRPLLGRTDISFNLGAPATVRIEIYNRSGQLQRVLVSGREMGSGRQVVTWNGQDHDDRTVRSGLYIVVIDANGAKAHKTVAVVNN